jgi:hypothetical protein
LFTRFYCRYVSQKNSLYRFTFNNNPARLKILKTGKKVAKNYHFVLFFSRFLPKDRKTLDFSLLDD